MAKSQIFLQKSQNFAKIRFWIRYIAYEAGLGQVGDMSEDWLFSELFPKLMKIIIEFHCSSVRFLKERGRG